MSSTPNAERKTLILTGASRGIGHATVKRFASAGWRVITCSRHAFPENCPWEMGPEDHIQVDLADPDDTLRAIGEMRRAARRRRILASARWSTTPASRPRATAALGCAPSTPRSTTGSTSSRSISSRPIMLARGLIEELERAKGAVVNVTSIAGGRVHPFAGAAYATSKAALAALTREMAIDFGPRGIRVNAISPGEIDTAILSPGTDRIVQEQIPLRRLGEPEEVAKAIYFLCTDQSSYVNGAELHINGGQHV